MKKSESPLFWPLALLALVLLLGLLLGSIPQALAQGSTTWYVSRSAPAGGDGRSWTSAWNEMDQIQWSQIKPGDVIELDGGAVACPLVGDEWSGRLGTIPCGMVYNRQLTFGASGTAGLPITVRLSSEPGRNGTVILDANQTNFTYCGENGAMSAPPVAPNGLPRDVGIHLGERNWIVLDGSHWGGIVSRNAVRYGLDSFGDNVVVRYVKSHHHNNPADTTNSSNGINVQNHNADNVLLEYVEVYRNGQDALRLAGDNITLRHSYIHDHYCNHPDGIQSLVFTQNAGVGTAEQVVENLTIESSLFHNVDLQAIFLGENANHQSWNRGAIIRNNLFTSDANPATRYYIKTKHQNSTEFLIENNTFHYSTEFALEWCCAPSGSTGAIAPMTVRKNIFLEINAGASAFYFHTRGGTTTYADNCRYQSGNLAGQYTSTGEITADPRFVNANRNPVSGNYGLQADSPCVGRGSSLKNLGDLLAVGTSAPPPAPTPTASTLPPTATTIPATDMPTATAVPPTLVPEVIPTLAPTLETAFIRQDLVSGCWVLYNAAGEAIDIEDCGP